MSSDKSSDNFKAPSQVFRWFEKMKANYENTVNAVLEKFEAQSEKQQERIDQSYQDHLANLKSAHQAQQAQSQATIAQLQADISYFKQQVSQQQHTIEQLNARYDAVMTTFLEQKKRDIDIKAVFDDEIDEAPLSVSSQTSSQLNNQLDNQLDNQLGSQLDTPIDNQPHGYPNNQIAEEKLANNPAHQTIKDTSLTQEVAAADADEVQAPLMQTESINASEPADSSEQDEELATRLYEEAMSSRENSEPAQAIALFKEAAKLGCVKSRGAIGRAYFLAEGVEEDEALGLAWLISAAELGLPQAVKRVDYFKDADEALYQQALALKDAL